MKILVTTDFYDTYELYETENPEGLKEYVKVMANENRSIELDPDEYKLIGTHDEIWTQEALEAADEVIFIEDYIESED